MWQRFTERARRIVFFAQEEAGKLGENYVSTEHLLLGMVREDDSVAARILTMQNVSPDSIREEILKWVTRGDGRLGQDMQLTPRSKRVIDLAYDEARQLSNNYIGTEHILLGLIREGDGLAGRVLAQLGVELEATREIVRNLQDKGQETEAKRKTETAPNVDEAEEAAPDGVTGWEKFTKRGRKIVFAAQEEATRLGKAYPSTDFVSTEHILLGITREADCVAAKVLEGLGVSLKQIRSEIERQFTQGDGKMDQKPQPQLTPRAKRVIYLAHDEAGRMKQIYIGSEHLLLGLLREGEGLAGRVLAKLGVELERTRREVIALSAPQWSDGPETNREERASASDNQKPGTEQMALASELLAMAGRVMKWNATDLRAELDAAKAKRENEEADVLRQYIAQAHPLWAKKSLVSLLDVSEEQFLAVLDVAAGLKALDLARKPGIEWQYTRTLAMIFEKPSLRTRVSFEASMAHLRGHAINLAPGEVGIGTREPVEDVAGVLSRWVDVIAARVFKHETVAGLAEHGTIPVINALSDREHPIQAFADLLTLREKVGPLGSEMKLAYVGDGNNVLHALLIACALTGVNIAAACPEGFQPDSEYVAKARELAEKSGATVTVTTDAAEAVKAADAIYTDVWTSMGQEEERESRLQIFAPYQINAELLSAAKPNALVLHCLPAHRGEEVSAEVMDAHAATIYEQAENRLHTQKALLMLIIGL